MDRPHPFPTKPDHAVKILQKMHEFARKEKNTDVELRAAGVPGAAVQCHSSVLCAQSPFFDGLCVTEKVVVIDFHQQAKHAKQALEQVRRYLYLGTLELNEDIVEPVLIVAEKMRHEALIDECEQYLISTLSVSKFRKFIKDADSFHLVHLSRACEELKIAKFSLLINEPWFLPSLSVHDLICLLSHDQLGVSSEDEALDAVSKWLGQCTAPENEKEEYTDLLLPHVRLPMCDQQKLEAAVEPTNTSTPSALKLRILHFLLKKDVGCSENPRGQTEEVTVIVGGRKEGNRDYFNIFFPDTKRSDVPFPATFRCCFYSVCRDGSILYLSGGYSYSQKKSISTVYKFSCEWGTMEEISSLPCARDHHGSARVGNRLYIIGGYYREDGDIKTWHRIVHVLDLESMAWSTVRDLPYGVENPAVVVIDQSIFLFGGWLKEGGYSCKVMKYEPHTDTWTACRDMPRVESFCTNSTVSVGTDMYVLAWDKFLCYKTKEDQWSSLDAPPMPSYWPSLVHHNGALVASGGHEKFDGHKHPHNRRQRFDLRSRKWSLLEDTLPLALSYHSSFVLRLPKSS